jgi:hypothetical protein
MLSADHDRDGDHCAMILRLPMINIGMLIVDRLSHISPWAASKQMGCIFDKAETPSSQLVPLRGCLDLVGSHATLKSPIDTRVDCFSSVSPRVCMRVIFGTPTSNKYFTSLYPTAVALWLVPPAGGSLQACRKHGKCSSGPKTHQMQIGRSEPIWVPPESGLSYLYSRMSCRVFQVDA